MEKVSTFHATHGLGRANISTAEADAIVERVNVLTDANGDSLYRDRVQAEIDNLASAEIQKLYKITIYELEDETEV